MLNNTLQATVLTETISQINSNIDDFVVSNFAVLPLIIIGIDKKYLFLNKLEEYVKIRR